MKKRILVFAAMLLFIFSSIAIAFDSSGQSAEKTASAAITSGAAVFHGLVVMSDGTNEITVNGYDNTSNSGKKLFPTWTVTTSSSNRAQALSIMPPVKCTVGIYIEVTVGGGGTVAYMAYFNKL